MVKKWVAMEKDDSKLIKLFLTKKNPTQFFQQLMEKYKVRVFTYILRKVSHKNDAEDIYQEVWLKIAKALPQYKEQNKFVNFLFFVATNACYDYFRKKKKDQENLYQINTDDNNDTKYNKMLENIKQEDTLNALEEIEFQEKKNKLKLKIAELPEKQKEVFLLRMEGLSFAEIAEMTGNTINTLLSRMRYATVKLKTS